MQPTDGLVAAGGSLIPINTPKGTFRVWTKRVGNNPDVKLLLLHGGPGATHEYFENFEDHLPGAGLEFIYYDQLGSGHSDRPDDAELWELDRFVDELEQVRTALGLDGSNFFLLGHSWGGILAIEYALHHGEHLKGLVISNMMSSCPAYNDYAQNVLMPQMDQAALKEIKGFEARDEVENPRYIELLLEHHYVHHVLRRPVHEWPESVNRSFGKINQEIYVRMQGPSELGLSGTLIDWDRTDDLERIVVPTLVIGARHDTMDPAFMQEMAERLPNGRYLECPNGSHLAMWDDEETYFAGLIDFLLSNSSRS
jgi:proline iminopeptidase